MGWLKGLGRDGRALRLVRDNQRPPSGLSKALACSGVHALIGEGQHTPDFVD
jgi:hypothetical protein